MVIANSKDDIVPSTASLTTQIVNPILESTFEAFELMMDVQCRKLGMSLVAEHTAFNPISSVIGLTGHVVGSICLSYPKQTAFNCVKRMVDMDVTEISGLVCDCVSEFSNVIAGSAKDKVVELNLEIGLPTVVRGENHRIDFPRNCNPICVDFDSDVGPFKVIFGFVDKT